MSETGDGIILWTQGFGMSHGTYRDHIGKEHSHYTAHHQVMHINTLSTFSIYHSTPSSHEADFRGVIFIPDYGEEDVAGKIHVKGGEHLSARIKVLRFSSMDAGIEVANRKSGDLEAKVRVNPYYDFRSRMKVLRYSELLGQMTVRSYSDFTGQISVPPRNKMSGFVDLFPIPRIHLDLEPIKDAFFRSGVRSLNYGTESTMVTGSIDNSPYTPDRHEVFRSILQFKLEHIPETAIVEKAILRLTPSSALPYQQFEVRDALGSWTETMVAWINQPAMGSYSKGEQTTQGQLAHIEFDILELVKDWVENGKDNFGLFLKAIDEAQIHTASFFTREAPVAGNRPRLEIVYYDPAMVISPGASDFRSKITVIAHRAEHLPSRIEIRSHLGEQFFPATMYVTNPNMREGRIKIIRRQMSAVLYVKVLADLGIAGSIVVPSKRLGSDFDSEIVVSKRQMVGKIYLQHYGQQGLESEMIIVNSKEVEEKFQVTISQRLIKGELSVKARRKLDSRIIIPNDREVDAPFRLVVTKTTLSSRITIKDTATLAATIVVPNGLVDDWPARLIVSHYFGAPLNSKITVNRRSLTSRLSISEHAFLAGRLQISKPSIDEVTGQLIIRGRSQFTGKIDVERADYLGAVIRTISPYMPSRMTIAGQDAIDLAAQITVNVKMIHELDARIVVKNPRDLYCVIEIIPRERQPAYAFIM